MEKRRQRHVLLLMFAMIGGGFLEFASIGAIVPFLGVLLSPERALDYDLFRRVVNLLGISGRDGTVILVTALFLGIIVFSALARGFLLWLNVRISHAIGGDFEREVYRRTLYQPYEVHTQQNLSTVIAGVGKAGSITSTILAFLSILQGLVIILFIGSAIFIVDFRISISTFVTVGVIYLGTMKFSRSLLRRNGEIVASNANVRLKWIQESLGGIRDILLEGRQEQYCQYFAQKTYQVKRAAGSNRLIGQSPRLVIEPIGIVIIGIVSCVIALTGDLAAEIPTLGAIAFAAQRLLPTAQQVYGGWSSITGSLALIRDVFDIINQPIRDEFLQDDVEPLAFHEELRLNQLNFEYDATKERVLRDITLSIKKGSCVGIAGRTGCGKSTLLDLMLGLLTPANGEITLDGQQMSGHIRQRWQRTVAHVPQDVFLTDATIAENIAFGVTPKNVDMDRVRVAANRAQLGDMIAKLPKGLNTVVGERGQQLSGGQRQRVGIARALYRHAAVMVFDEATSALDVHTERAVIDEITNSGEDTTLIIVTHRLPTLEHCNLVYVLDNGRVVKSGNYQEVIRSKYLSQDERDRLKV